jgi:hypothetical protein
VAMQRSRLAAGLQAGGGRFRVVRAESCRQLSTGLFDGSLSFEGERRGVAMYCCLGSEGSGVAALGTGHCGCCLGAGL